MAAYITQVKRLRDYTARNAAGVGAHTAQHSSGPMAGNELWGPDGTTLDVTNTWYVTVGATGAVAITTRGQLRAARLNLPAASDTANLFLARYLPGAFNVTATRSIYKMLVAEWEAELGTVENIDNATFFMGIGTGGALTRASDNVAGFYLASDVMRTLSDSATTEETNAFTNPTLTQMNKFKIEAYGGSIYFWVNDVKVATHTAQLPVGPQILNFNCGAEAATGATALYIGPVRYEARDEL